MHQVRQLVMSSGERLPLLCDAAGQPLMSPLLFSLTELRARGRSSATIRHAMEAIRVLHKSLATQCVDLDTRLADGSFLQMQEIDTIVSHAARPTRDDGGNAGQCVSSAHAAARLHYIHAYLRWMGNRQLMRLQTRGPYYLELKDRIDKVCAAIKARSPSLGVRSDLDQRQGLEEEDFERVEAISSGRAECMPWRTGHASSRNQLILRWFIDLGIRRGELLNVRISDINFQQNVVRIARRADCVDDPRTHQPLVKTQARELPMSDALADSTYSYIMDLRGNQGAARAHDYLFVAGGTGQPLSYSAVNKLFEDMRRVDASLPASLTPHVIRHTWNDRFSRQMEENAVDVELEKRIRSTLMGWSMTSETAATYTRRHVRKKASAAMRQMQAQLKIVTDAV